MTSAERREALQVIETEVTACTRCRLHAGRIKSVPGEGHPDTEVVFVGEGPGQNEDRAGRPFVGRAGDLLVRMLGTVGWKREEVFITNVVKCRPPDNRDPEPDEIEACRPYLERQLAIIDPALIVTLGRHSMGRFIPGAKISQIHGTTHPVDPATGARSAMVFAMYHPAAALRSSDVERQSFEDAAGIPAALLDSRRLRGERAPKDGDPSAVTTQAVDPSALDHGALATSTAPLGDASATPSGDPPAPLTAGFVPARSTETTTINTAPEAPTLF